MKKLLLSMLVGLFFSSLQAQNLQITSPNSANYTYNGSSSSLAHVDVHVKNNNSSQSDIFVQRKIVSKDPSHLSYFCFGVTCYPPNVSKSPDVITLAAGATDTSIITYLDPLGVAGTSIVTYCVKNVTETDSACITITYDMLATGIINNSHKRFVKAFPNPAESDLNLVYNTEKNYSNKVIQLLDLNGKLVYSEKVENTTGLIQINVSEFPSGVYVCNLIADDAVIAREKVVVK